MTEGKWLQLYIIIWIPESLISLIVLCFSFPKYSDETQTIELPFNEYGRHLADNAVIRVVTTVRVKETNKFYVDSFDVQVDSPDCITLEVGYIPSC